MKLYVPLRVAGVWESEPPVSIPLLEAVNSPDRNAHKKGGKTSNQKLQPVGHFYFLRVWMYVDGMVSPLGVEPRT